MTTYYGLELKHARLAILNGMSGFRQHIAMLEDMEALDGAVEAAAPDVIVHLAAQAGVRYSLENPRAYVDSNLVGAFNVLECARKHPVRHLLMASTSSVYGANERTPFREDDKADRPLTLYAATKKANEAMAHSYAHLWAIPTTMFRFFTVYGPWGRPDMAPLKFVEAIENGRTIDIYNHGKMERDFTYIDDLVEAIRRADRRSRRRWGRAIPRHRRWRHTASSISGAARPVQSARLHRDRRTKTRQEGGPQLCRHAKGRRAPDLGRQRPAHAANRLSSVDERGRRRVGAGRLVSRLSRQALSRKREPEGSRSHNAPRTASLQARPMAYSGILSCFFQGFSSFLWRSSASARAIRLRVACGVITSSI